MRGLITNLSLRGFQDLNAEIYRRQNDRHFDTGTIVRRMIRQAIKVLGAVKDGKDDQFLSYRLGMTLSWSLALANRLHLDLSAVFKGMIPASRTQSLVELQNLRMQGLESKLYEAIQLVVEISSLDELLEDFQATHESRSLQEIGRYLLMEVIGLLCMVATSAGLNLAVEMETQFGNGCPKCLKTPCECQFSVPKMV